MKQWSALLAALMVTGCGTATLPQSHISNHSSTNTAVSTNKTSSRTNTSTKKPSSPKDNQKPKTIDTSTYAVVPAQSVPVKAESMLKTAGKGSIVNLEMYEFTNGTLVNALIAAKERGAQVRVILDATEKGNNATRQRLTQVGIPTEMMRVGSDGYQDIDHIKLFVVNKNLLMGSVNWGAKTYLTTDADVYVPHQTKTADELFNYDWRIGKTEKYVREDHLKNLDTSFKLYTDNGIEPAVAQVIHSAKKSIQLYMFSLDDRPLVSDLIAAKKRGVDVYVKVDQHYERRVNTRSITELKQAGITVEQAPYTSVLHAKVLVADGKIVVFGSANYTNSGMKYNHEIVGIVHSTTVAKQIIHAVR